MRSETQRSTQVVQTAALALGGQLINAGCYFVVLVLLARSLGARGLGTYYTVVAMTLALHLLGDCGLSTVLMRRLARESARGTAVFSEAFGMALASALLSSIMLALIGVTWAAMSTDQLRLVQCGLAAASCVGMQLQRMCVAAFREYQPAWREVTLRVLQGGTLLALVAALSNSRTMHAEEALGALAFADLSAACAGLVLLWIAVGWFPLRLSREQARSWLAEAAPLGIGDAVRELSWQLDTILLGILQPASAVGLYSIAYRPLSPLKWLPQAVCGVSFRFLARWASTNTAQLERAFFDATRILLAINGLVGMLVFVFAGEIVHVLGGPGFAGAAVPLRVLVVTVVLAYTSIPYRFLFAALGKGNVFAGLMLAVCAVECLLEFVLISCAGLLGACCGMLVGELLCFSASGVLCRRLGVRGIRYPVLGGAVISAGTAGAWMWASRSLAWPAQPFVCAAAVPVYVSMLLVAGVLTRQDLLLVYRALFPCRTQPNDAAASQARDERIPSETMIG